MFSTAFFLAFTGFYLQYNLSRKVKMRNKPAYLTYIETHVLLSRIAGIAAMAMALLLLILKLGAGSGIFGFGAVLMLAGCLIVTLAPFRYLRPAFIVTLYLGLTALEILFF